MRERIESKHVTKEIKSQMPVIPVEIVKERGCTFCPYYLGNYEKQPRCMMKTCAWDDENERFHPVLRELIPFYKEKMEKAEEKFLAVKQIYTTLLKMFADEMKQEELEKDECYGCAYGKCGPCIGMEERGYYDEEGNLDIDAVEADGYEFGMDLAFGVLSVCEGKPERVLEIQQYVNEQYECCSNKKFMKVLETIARMNGNEEVYIEDMYACNKEARNYYLSELMMCFNFVFNEMCHGTGSAAGCDFNNEEE